MNVAEGGDMIYGRKSLNVINTKSEDSNVRVGAFTESKVPSRRNYGIKSPSKYSWAL